MESFSRRSLERNSSNRPIWKPALPDVAPFFRVPKRKCDRVKEVSISHFFQTTMADTHLGSGVRAWSDLDFLRAFENLSFPPDQFRHREHLRVAWLYLKRSEEHTSELQSRLHLVCRLLLEKKKTKLYQLLTHLLQPIYSTHPLCSELCSLESDTFYLHHDSSHPLCARLTVSVSLPLAVPSL